MMSIYSFVVFCGKLVIVCPFMTAYRSRALHFNRVGWREMRLSPIIRSVFEYGMEMA